MDCVGQERNVRVLCEAAFNAMLQVVKVCLALCLVGVPTKERTQSAERRMLGIDLASEVTLFTCGKKIVDESAK